MSHPRRWCYSSYTLRVRLLIFDATICPFITEYSPRKNRLMYQNSWPVFGSCQLSNSDRDIRYIDCVLVIVLLRHCIQERAGMAAGRIMEIQRNLQKNRWRELSAVFWWRGCQAYIVELVRNIANGEMNLWIKNWLNMNVGAAYVKMSRCTNKAYVRNRDGSLEHVTV